MDSEFKIPPIVSLLFNRDNVPPPPGIKKISSSSLSPYSVPFDSSPSTCTSPHYACTPESSAFPNWQFFEALLKDSEEASQGSSVGCSPAEGFSIEDWPAESQTTIDVSNFCKSKQGSRRLQQTISRSSPEEIQGIVNSITPLMADLMTHKYGNYVCQSLAHICSSTQRMQLLAAMESSLPKIAKNGFGTHALQTFIGMASMPQEHEIYCRAFEGLVFDLARDDKASHVIQKLAITLPRKDFIVNAIVRHTRALACDKLGTCLVKKCLDNPRVRDSLTPHLVELAQDPFGNYAVQLLLEMWGPQVFQSIAAQFRGNVVQLSMQKFSSNVLEKCMRLPGLCTLLTQSILKQDLIKTMLASNYGCYVLKAALETSDPETLSTLRQLLSEAAAALPSRKMQSRWIELLRL